VASVRQTVSIDRGDIGVRIDRVLFRHLAYLRGVTRSRIQRLVDNGSVCINGRPVSRSSSRVAAGDTIAIELPDRAKRRPPVPEALPLDVLHEDDHLLIVNKPAGQVSHPAFRNTTGTLLNALLAYADGRWVPTLLSRLDKDTSGLLLVAKNRTTHVALQQAMHANRIEKDYLAFVIGRPPAKGTITLALDRDPWDRRRVTVRDRGGVPAVTRFERLKTASVNARLEVSLVRCRLVTGRMHQVRVHLAASGWPILGDPVYRSRTTAVAFDLPTIERQALHAHRLVLTHPITGRAMDVTAPLPPDMERVLDFVAGHLNPGVHFN